MTAKYSEFEKLEKSMFATVDTLKIDDLKTSSISLRVGGQIFNLVPSAESTLPENQIREELEAGLAEKRDAIKKSIKNKMDIVTSMLTSIQNEYDRKEHLLRQTMSKSSPMPEVTWQHALRGLSVVKGDQLGSVVWLVKRVYSPKFMDHKSIEPLYVKKLMTNIIVKILTRDEKVLSVSTHYTHTLEYFEHYHQSHPDCWGNWTRPATWSSADDILQIADDAIAVMENINTMSIARRNPALLPKLETLRRHIITTPVDGNSADIRLSKDKIRNGISTESQANDVWGN